MQITPNLNLRHPTSISFLPSHPIQSHHPSSIQDGAMLCNRKPKRHPSCSTRPFGPREGRPRDAARCCRIIGRAQRLQHPLVATYAISTCSLAMLHHSFTSKLDSRCSNKRIPVLWPPFSPPMTCSRLVQGTGSGKSGTFSASRTSDSRLGLSPGRAASADITAKWSDPANKMNKMGLPRGFAVFLLMLRA